MITTELASRDTFKRDFNKSIEMQNGERCLESNSLIWRRKKEENDFNRAH